MKSLEEKLEEERGRCAGMEQHLQKAVEDLVAKEKELEGALSEHSQQSLAHNLLCNDL